jgi:hypothetical protein
MAGGGESISLAPLVMTVLEIREGRIPTYPKTGDMWAILAARNWGTCVGLDLESRKGVIGLLAVGEGAGQQSGEWCRDNGNAD